MLPLAGLCSAAICHAIDSSGIYGGLSIFHGIVFGAVLGGCLVFVHPRTSISTAVVFTIASEVISFISVGLAAVALMASQVVVDPRPGEIDSGWFSFLDFKPALVIAVFVGGTIGAAGILVETLYLFRPREFDAVSLLKAALWSPVGGGLAICGYGFAQRPHDFGTATFLWQTGVSVTLAFFLSGRRDPATRIPV